MLGHEKLDVYQCSLNLFKLASTAQANVPRGYAPLADQLRRSSTSILLNIAEGCGKTTPPDKGRFYAIARGSALESAATFDALHSLGSVEDDDQAKAKALLVRIVSMLTRMCEKNGNVTFGR